MADKASDKPVDRKRVGDYNPNAETGDTLDKIEDLEVEIESVAFENRKGRRGDYTLSIITLTDGRVFHTGSEVIAESLGKVPKNAFPVIATFSLTPSASNPGQSYWTVE